MLYSRDDLRVYLARLSGSDQSAPAGALQAAIEALDQGRPATDEILQSVVEAASSSVPSTYEIATSVLGELAAYDERADARVIAMCDAAEAHVRHNAVLCVDGRQGSTDPVLRAALLDRSARVRAKAADWIGRLGRVELIGALEGAAAREKAASAKKVMAHELTMLRDGYAVGSDVDGYSAVTFSTGSGRITRVVETAKLERVGIERILAAVKEGRGI